MSPAANDTIDSSVLTAAPLAEANDGRWTANRLGMILMVLGLVSLIGGSLPMLVGFLSRCA